MLKEKVQLSIIDIMQQENDPMQTRKSVSKRRKEDFGMA